MAMYDVHGKSLMTLKSKEVGSVIMDSTVFFAEQGGQLYDRGTLRDSFDVIYLL